MLAVNELTVTYGQSEVIHQLSFAAAEARNSRHHGPQRHGQDHVVQGLMGVLPTRSGTVESTASDVTRSESYLRVANGHRLRAAGPHDLSDADGRREHRDRPGERQKQAIPDEIYALFPVL